MHVQLLQENQHVYLILFSRGGTKATVKTILSLLKYYKKIIVVKYVSKMKT